MLGQCSATLPACAVVILRGVYVMAQFNMGRPVYNPASPIDATAILAGWL